MTAKYDIEINKGSNFDMWLQYLTDGNTAVNLNSYDAEFQIRKFKGAPYPLIFATENGITYGYSVGLSSGIAGIGGISLNTNYDGSGITGGIRISVDHVSTESLPFGKYFYDFKLIIGTTYSQKLLEGRVSVIDGVNP